MAHVLVEERNQVSTLHLGKKLVIEYLKVSMKQLISSTKVNIKYVSTF